MGYNEELNVRVAARHQDIIDKVVEMQLEAEAQAPNNPFVHEARKLITVRFGTHVLPPPPEPETFVAPNLDPFADITLADLESTEDKIQRLSESLATTGLSKSERVQVMRELRQLRSQ